MGDWKDDAANKLSEQLAKERRDKESKNNDASLINGRASAFWDKILSSLNDAIRKMNDAAGGQVISFGQDNAPGVKRVTLTRNTASQKSGVLSWHINGRKITIDSRPEGEREFHFKVEGDQVVLEDQVTHESTDSDTVARRLVDALMNI
jgi:hypothetical protein